MWSPVLVFLFLGSCYAIQFPNLPEFDAAGEIKARCDQKGGEGTYDSILASKDKFTSCMEGIIDVDTIQAEVEESKKTGSMDEVFGKYCKKRPKIETCVFDVTDKVKLCLDEKEQDALNITMDIVRQLGDFICFKDGDRIAMFVAEGGVDCIKNHVEGIKDCLNSTFNAAPTEANAIPNLLIDKKKCDDLGKVQVCVVAELEKCKDSTPANIVDALFKFIRKSACKNKQKRRAVFKRSILSSNQQIQNLFDTFQKFIKERCTKNRGENGFDEFKNTLYVTRSCLAEYFATHYILVAPVSELKESVLKCTEMSMREAENCLDENEKYYPQFYQDISMGLVDFLYEYRKNVTTSSWNMETINCFQNLRNPASKEILSNCFFDSQKLAVYSKEAVCERLEVAKECLKTEIKRICIDDITIKNFRDELLKIFSKPCQKEE